ncbi:hypothetical protein D3273_10690 [Lichenibacterium minor]|uniref:Uncharacterized protein n=1 Tax=Lichenibacterium minor TaxID=2316528 RepID=A0A4V1RUP7_9HYPH|nr:hypothetical protein [Lichenibacterium minor]RYC31894.1 hypothetical protein D3273_10690 [Lichenibacterium minor]
MQITKDTLPALIESDTKFISIFKSYAEEAMWSARLVPQFSKPRLVEARGAWLNDVDRVGSHEKHLVNGLDHFKQAGHLAFWLRRMSPLIEASDPTQDIQDSSGYELDETESAFRDLLFAGPNEYLAFDFGFQIVRFYEMARIDRVTPCPDIRPSRDYYQTTCHFLKYKNVSPHGLHIIYKSLFVM